MAMCNIPSTNTDPQYRSAGMFHVLGVMPGSPEALLVQTPGFFPLDSTGETVYSLSLSSLPLSLLSPSLSLSLSLCRTLSETVPPPKSQLARLQDATADGKGRGSWEWPCGCSFHSSRLCDRSDLLWDLRSHSYRTVGSGVRVTHVLDLPEFA